MKKGLIFCIAILGLQVLGARDFSTLKDKELLKLAGTLPSSEAIDYRMEVSKRLKVLNAEDAKKFRASFSRMAKKNLSKMSEEDFKKMREEVRKELEEKTKALSTEEIKEKGLNVSVCSGDVRKVWCKAKKKEKHCSPK
ncbi:DUF1104 domain-containing protein [Helicobacter cetorum]|uniref:Periplasmic protein n=1 Tax=Helicobacter cetorum (strain ATCC BAA-540 / CCUG 52418 / MIT 99-5656) TaxID=1163745 RepID=I0EQN7_HELCM|nr:DUF1104 domain-containing protein [Helicobacter cetorum]AFI05256.1 hypothetical protein HCD_01120 [Helicobacter cetorum MIT 99-5656]